ncbi:ATP-binding protein [Nocardioides sambongensis]|uniref:anti-sigma factor n=1 Tax=Nocardioides sambongensis TaxID=2589074 RepID=UPI00112D7BBB|nr:anti-sigma factor [Nocardioides sambongensis]
MSGTSSLAVEGAHGAGAQPTVELRLPADGAYASVLRTLAAGLAARLDFTMDDIEDLRMVVSEAASLVLERAAEGGVLTCTFDLSHTDRLSLEVATETSMPASADYESFGWQVLAVLAEEASIDATASRFSVRATVLSALERDAGA